MKHQSSPKQRHRGFSLVELLVVIAVIGVMAGIAIPMVSNINSNASVTSAKKQAQQIASVFNSGQAAGAFGSAASVAAAITAVGNGGTGQNGLAGSQFIVPGVSAGMDADKPAEQQVSHYLAVDGGALVYKEDGGAAAEDPSPWEADPTHYGTQQEANEHIAYYQQQGPQYEFRARQEGSMWIVERRLRA